MLLPSSNQHILYVLAYERRHMYYTLLPTLLFVQAEGAPVEGEGARAQESIVTVEESMGSGTANAAGTASEVAALVAADSQGGKDDSPAGKCPNVMESRFHNIETAYTDIVVCPPTIEPAKDGEFSLDAVSHIYYMLSPHSLLDTICWMFVVVYRKCRGAC